MNERFKVGDLVCYDWETLGKDYNLSHRSIKIIKIKVGKEIGLIIEINNKWSRILWIYDKKLTYRNEKLRNLKKYE